MMAIYRTHLSPVPSFRVETTSNDTSEKTEYMLLLLLLLFLVKKILLLKKKAAQWALISRAVYRMCCVKSKLEF